MTRLFRPFYLAFSSAVPLALFRSTVATRHGQAFTSPPRFCAAARASQGSTPPTMSMSSVASPAREISGPTWQLEYTALDDPTLLEDLAIANRDMDEMERTGSTLADLVPLARELTDEQITQHDIRAKLLAMFRSYWNAVILLRNVSTYASCVASVDGTNAEAKKLAGQIQVLFARVRTAYEPAALILDLCPDALFKDFLAANEETRAAEFMLSHSRKMARHRLSLQEENMVTKLSVTGHSAWGSLYTDLSTVLPVNVREADGSVKVMGIASAEAMRDSPDEEVRRASWEGIRQAWLPHQETCAAVLNAITGWRLDMYEKRKFDSFLTSSLHSNRMSNDTLAALLKSLDSSVEVGRRALAIQAKVLKKDALEPWDLFAPAPLAGTYAGKMYTFDEGIELIADAVGAVDESAGKFVRMMKENGWIEASRGDKKRPGA